jgi:hypothetical protein
MKNRQVVRWGVDDELLRALARHSPRVHAESDPGMPTSSDASLDVGAGGSELSRPLSAEERNSVLDAVFARVDAEAVDAAAAPTVLAERRASRGRMAAVIGTVLAIAAALVMWMARPGVDAVDALPGYSVTGLRGGASAVRSDPTALDRELLLADAASEIDVVVSPERAVAGPLAVTLVAETAGQPPRMVEVEAAEISASGAVRLRGPLSRFIALEPGAWQLWVVVTPSDRRPASADAVLAEASSSRAGFRVKIVA